MLGLATGRRRRGLAFTAAVAAAFLLTLPAGAPARDVSVRDKGGAKGKGLTRTERKALDIKRVSARGGDFGVLVRVRFKGDLQESIGRRHLRRSLVALVLRPKSESGSPTVLATTGAAGKARTLRSSRSKRVGVVRDGDDLLFYVFGGGLDRVKRIQVKAFKRRPRARATGAADDIILDQQALDAILDGTPADSASLPTPSTSESNICEVLLEEYRTYLRQLKERTKEANELDERKDQAEEELQNAGTPQEHAAAQKKLDAAERASNAADETVETLQTIIKRARRELVRFQCFKIVVRSVGYEHGQGFTDVCGEAAYDPPEAVFDDRGAVLPQAVLFRRREDGSFERVKDAAFSGRSLEDPPEVFGFQARIKQYGTYKLVLVDDDDYVREIIIEVPEPPPQATKDC